MMVAEQKMVATLKPRVVRLKTVTVGRRLGRPIGFRKKGANINAQDRVRTALQAVAGGHKAMFDILAAGILGCNSNRQSKSRGSIVC
jgi:hypothetical protein